MFRPADRARTKEGIFAYGPYNSGKSEGWAETGALYRATDTPGHFHIISTEYEMAQRVAEGYDDFDANSTIYETHDYASLVDISQKVREVGTENDWVVVDSIGHAQTWARDLWFRDQHGGKTYREWMAEGGMAKDVGPAGWIQMDNLYRQWLVPNITMFPGHRYACAQAEMIETGGAWADSDKILAMYGRHGLKPVAHKESGYAWHTVLMMTHPSPDDYCITTIDDPKREHVTRLKVVSFPHTYLRQIAGWVLT